MNIKEAAEFLKEKYPHRMYEVEKFIHCAIRFGKLSFLANKDPLKELERVSSELNKDAASWGSPRQYDQLQYLAPPEARPGALQSRANAYSTVRHAVHCIGDQEAQNAFWEALDVDS